MLTTVYFIEVFKLIKSIAYFPLQCALNSGPVMSALLDCLQAGGIQTQENSRAADAAIIWSVLWNGRMKANQQVYDHYRKQNKPVIVVDVGALYRGQTWKIAVNNITADGYYGHKENLNPDRPRQLRVSSAINFSTNPAVLIAAQHSRSLQVAHLQSQETWISQIIKQVRSVTDRPICVRSHPRSRLDTTLLPNNITIETPKKLNGTYDGFDIHFDFHAVVNYNSGPGIQAAISGTRPIVDTTSLAHPVAVTLDNIDKPYTQDREQWLIEICHTEYTLEELKKGIWLNRIRQALLV